MTEEPTARDIVAVHQREFTAMAPDLSPAPEPARVMIVEDAVLVRSPIAEDLRAVDLEVIEESNKGLRD